MKKLFFVSILLFGGLFASLTTYGQQSTIVNFNIDDYDWNKLIVSHFFDKHNGFGVQFWYKDPTALKRVRLYYQRKVVNYSKEKNSLQITGGFGLQITSRKGKSNSYQMYIPVEVVYKRKLTKSWSFNARNINHFSVSTETSQGEHTVKTTTDLGFKYQKTAFLYRGDQLNGFKTGLKTNFEGGGATYDITKNLTLGGILYTDLKEKNRSAHFAIIGSVKF